MKHLAITFALLFAVAAATCYVSFRLSGDPALEAALVQRDSLLWLRTEFKLTGAEFARIKELHDSYALECEKHCREIQRVLRTKEEVRTAAGSNTEAIRAAEQELEHLRATCENAIAAHVRRCAAVMSPQAGERYLAMVLPKIPNFDHRTAPDVRLNPHNH